ncbi:MAG: BlaI/MecI/CopY family transcriptional regulator [Candidatus Cyclonatronum sp.]|uniref:BlaI/MecI/CopY family transcriptional regulator n=1 Tax=Cyclonatronum sp. TaxID=3024185 RepID=UPI0025C09270|nr:BlaI/MecI/CopY family transcriptional regulator [Cyclonatronum sp.]MCH8487290.1 BlaI/MecI/CopY family transcriptional regulator [Cyclonatronum sp.]
MKKTITPVGDSEMEILHIVWDKGEATVAEVHEHILGYRKVAYTTVMTIMKKLADKGLLSFRKDGLTYVYRAEKPESEVKHSLLRQMLDKVFKGSPAEMVQSLVENEALKPEEKAEIESLIEKLRGGS